jgi:hypothetical protein
MNASPYLLRLLAQPCGPDRSRQLWHLVRIALRDGHDPAAIHALAVRHRPSAEKYGERLGSEVDRILAKLV